MDGLLTDDGVAAKILRTRSVWTLLVANLAPLLGVLFFHWDVLTVMLLYWAESGIVGFFGVVKIPFASSWAASPFKRWGAPPLMLFFAFHYSFFMFGHFIFIVLFFAEGGVLRAGVGPPGAGVEALVWAEFVRASPAIVLLFLSHAYSFYVNFLQHQEWRHATPENFMTAPYGRIMLMHVTLVVGGVPALLLGSPVAALVFMVVLKIAADVRGHLRERRKAQERAARPEAVPPNAAPA